MVIGSLGYVINDALVRRVTENGLDVYQVLCIRSIAIAVLLAGLAAVRGEATTRAHLRGPFLLRVAAEVTGAALFFAAIVQMEFANAQAILQIVPFAVTLAAALVLGERVAPAQYIAILVGFIGVLLIVRPATDGFSAWSLMVVASAVFLVVRELATRDVPADVPALSIAFATAAGLAALTGAISIFTGWHSINLESAWLIALSMVALVLGYLFSIQTVRVGDLSVSAPFRYSLLLGAVVMGYLLFDEVPDTLTVIGGSVIIGSGLLAIYLDRQRGGRADLPSSLPL